MPDDIAIKLETDNAFLREKFKISEEKRKKEIDSNLDLFSTIQKQMKSAHEAPSEDTDEERRKFLTESNCIRLLNLVNPRGDTVYCMDALPEEISLYGPDRVMFSWENLEIDNLLADQERKRTISGSSSHSQEYPSTS